MTDTDLELIARYTRNGAEEAFAEIVRRHIDLVYSAALRQVRSPQLAEEVAQATFIKLARHAPKLAPDTILTAWLYQVTRREAIDVVRREARRQMREQIATEMNAINATATDWRQIEPLLDEAMQALDETERSAVLLRYFENKSLREVGQTLGTSENAAQKRVNRAVERLREFFAKRGVTIGASGLAVVISANAVQAAPGRTGRHDFNHRSAYWNCFSDYKRNCSNQNDCHDHTAQNTCRRRHRRCNGDEFRNPASISSQPA